MGFYKFIQRVNRGLGVGKGNADALQAKAEAWAKSPQFKTGDYTGFSTTFNKTFDPRAYQFDYMDPAAQQMMKKNAGADWPNLAAKIRAIKPSG